MNFPALANTPIIYVTGESSDQIDLIATSHGAFTVLYKPFDASLLVAAAQEAMKKAA